MRTAIKLLMFGSAIGAAVIAGRRAGRRSDAPGDADATAPLPAGISDVDPQPLTQISGEGIDPDATRAAHDEPRAQRERLAVPGENLP